MFATTHWSVVLTAGRLDTPDAHLALTRLCEIYWYPLYCAIRRKGYPPEDAQDLTQAFFAKLLSRNQIALADPERGRFRTFLMRSMENFLRTQHRDATSQKRGGMVEIRSWDAHLAEEMYSAEPPDELSPEMLFDKQWAGTLLEEVMARLRREFTVSGKAELFEALESHLWGDETSLPYTQISQTLSMTVVAVRVTLHRLRQRFHGVLREEIANTVQAPVDVEHELRHLRGILAK